MITKEEAQALLQIIGRAKFEGTEVITVATLIQKLNGLVEPIEEAPPLKKKD